MLIFFHIPKTAGTTFLNVLKKEYKNRSFTIDGINWAQSLRTIDKMSVHDASKIDLIMGHMSYSLKRHAVDRVNSAIYVSFFRDPVSLFLSTFSYIKRAKLNRYHKVAQNMNLEQWVEFRKNEHLDNLQSRHLLERLPIFNPLESDLNLLKSNSQVLENEITSRLSTIDYKFTTGNFDKALLFLAKRLQWKKKPYYKRLNISHSYDKNEISESLFRRIREMNWLDEFLYNQVLQEEVFWLNEINETELEKFQKKNESSIFRKLKI